MSLMSEEALDDDMLIRAYQQSFAKVSQQLDTMMMAAEKNETGSPKFTYKSKILGSKDKKNAKEETKNEKKTDLKSKDQPKQPCKTDSRQAKTSESSSTQSIRWKVKDHCRAVYREDGQEYEAIVTRIQANSQSCLVKYVGYGNIEAQRLQDLKPSHGEQARQVQCQQIGNVDQQSGDKSEQEEEEEEEAEQSDVIAEESASKHIPKLDGSQIPEMAFNCPYIPMPLKYLPKPSPNEDVDEMLSSMLMSWFMCGYHTGRYVEVKRKLDNKS